MTLPLTDSHYEALNRAHPLIKQLVSSNISTNRFLQFIDQYSGPSIEVQAIYPVLNDIKSQLDALRLKYGLGPQKSAFTASPEDAHTLETVFEFLWFVTRNLYFKARYKSLVSLIDIDILEFYRCTNLEVAIASMRLSVLSPIKTRMGNNLYADKTLLQLLDDMEMHNVIPSSGVLSAHVSDYAVYMGTCGSEPGSEEPRKQLLVGYDVLASISYDQLYYEVTQRTPATSKSTRYAHILDATLLLEYPELSKYAISVLTRASGFNATEFVRIDQRLRDGELLVSAIQTKNEPLIIAILDFYKKSNELNYMENDTKTLTTMGNFIILEHLERLSRNHSDLNVQIALLRVLVYSMKVDSSYDFAPQEEYISVVQSFFAMLKYQLEFDSWLDFQVQKGLLSVIMLLLEKDASGVLIIANDSLSIPVLASACENAGLSSLAIKCLVLLLGADLLCYSIIDNYKLWDSIIHSVKDPYALVQLYACLINSEHGLKLVENYNLRTRLLDTAIEYTFEANYFSREYYSSLTDAIVSDAPTLEAFAQRLPGILNKIMNFLDECGDESWFDFEHRLWGRHSRTANLVLHTVRLLSCTAHRDSIRTQLQSNTGLPILLRIFAHKHLPFAFPNSLCSQTRFSLLVNELMLADTAKDLLDFLLSGVVELLQSDLRGPQVRQLQIYLACVVNLNFRKSEEFTKNLIEWITQDPNFSKMATLIPQAIYAISDQKFDMLSGPDRAIHECYWYRLEGHRGQMSEVIMKRRLVGISDRQYFEKKQQGMLTQYTGMALDACRNCLLHFVDDMFRYKMVPKGFNPAIFVTGANDCFAKINLSSTRGRYILAQLNPLYYLNCFSVDGAMDTLFVNKGLETIIDLYARVHKPCASESVVLLNAYYQSDYIKKCKEVLNEAFIEFGIRSSVTSRLLEQCAAAGYNPMQAWAHMIKQIVEHHMPITNELMYCWHCDEQDVSAYLPLRGYILENLQDFFKDQDIDGYRHGSKILAMTLNILEVYEPIMRDLIPSLIARNTVPGLALVAGCYTLGEAKLNVPELPLAPSLVQNIADQDPLKVMCSVQIILGSGVKVPSSALSVALDTVVKCQSPRVVGAVLELATRCVIEHPDSRPQPCIVEQVHQYCLEMFEADGYTEESMICLSHLQEFILACCEADLAVLEATMAGLVYHQVGQSPKPLNELQIAFAKLEKRSPVALEASLNKHFMVLNDQVLVPRRSVCEAHQLPRVYGEIPDLNKASKHLIDQFIDQIIARSPLVIDSMQQLCKAHQASNSLYFYQSLEDAYRTELTEKQQQVNSRYLEAWEGFRKAVFGIRLYSDVLNCLTYFYGASAIYLSTSEKLDTLLRSVLEIMGHVGYETDDSRGSSWDVQVRNISDFIKRLLKCGDHTCQMIFESIKRILDSGSPYACLGFLYVGIPHPYDASVMKMLNKSHLLDTINDIVAKCESGAIDRLRARHFDRRLRARHSIFYNRLSAMWTNEMESYSSFKAKEGEHNQSGDGKQDPVRDGTDEDPTGDGTDEDPARDAPAGDGTPVNDISLAQSDSHSSSSHSSSSAISYGSEEIQEDEEFYTDREFSYPDTDVIPVGSLFGIGDFVEYAKTYPRMGLAWRINPPVVSATEGTTLEHTYSYMSPPDSEPLFFSDKNLYYLGHRGLNLMPIYLPGHPKFSPNRGQDYHYQGAVVDSQVQWMIGGSMFASMDRESAQFAARIMRPWTHGVVGAIDWSLVPHLEYQRAKVLSAPKEPQELDIANDTPAFVVAYETAIEKGRHLLENPNELALWGLSTEYLENIPQEYRLDALISYLTLNGGQEMTSGDIRATFDDDLAYDIALTETSVTTRLAVSAQFSKDDDPSVQLDIARFHEKPVHPPVTAQLLLEFGVYRPGMSTSFDPDIPDFSDDAALQNEVLLLFRDLLAENSPLIQPRNVEAFISWLQKSKSGNLNVSLLIDCLCCPIVLSHGNVGLGQLLSTLKESVEKSDGFKELELPIIEKLFAVYCSSFLSCFKQKTLRQIILEMFERGFVKKTTLQQIVCDELMKKLHESNKGEISDLTSLEELLMALTRHPLVRITGTAGIVQQAVEMGKNVSSAIKTHDITATMRLLRCYLLLVTLTPDARSAFIAFVKDNRKLVNKVILQDQTMLKSCCANMKGNYHLLDFKVRAGIIRGRFPQSSENAIRLKIGRQRIFYESYAAIKTVDPKEFTSSAFRIEFKAEMGFDGGGLTKEWLTVLARSVSTTEYGLFTRINNKYLHPNPQVFYQEADSNNRFYEFIGKMMAKSILIKESFDCNFSSIIYSSLVSKSPGPFSLEDLFEFDKELAQSLEWMLQNDISGIIMETFVTKSTAFGDLQTKELLPGGAQLEVTEQNKHQYVELMVEHILYKNVEPQIQAICQGFWSVIPLTLVNILSAAELENLLCGAQTIDVEEWQANTVYQTYNSSSPTIKYFWQAVKSLNELEQRQLLLFSTGSDRVSALGFSSGGTKFTIGKQYDGPTSVELKLPTSSTCISLLNLPEYRSYDEAIKSIRKALEYGSLGFGFS